MLGYEYKEMRDRGGAAQQKRLKAKLIELGVQLGPSISRAGAGQCGEHYFVIYPVPENPQNREFLGMHVKKGNSRDQSRCLRIYFFWDSKKRCVVVGWLPSHLDTPTG
jgi:hypothetical protein